MFSDYEVEIQVDELPNPYDNMDDWQEMDEADYLRHWYEQQEDNETE